MQVLKGVKSVKKVKVDINHIKILDIQILPH